jgi:small subunit ribosomal protein S17
MQVRSSDAASAGIRTKARQTAVASENLKANDSKRTLRRLRRGEVVSDVRDKTIRVVYHYSAAHKKYGKIIRQRTTMHVHDPDNTAKLGDIVEVMACRPISKTKHWRLARIIQRAADRAAIPSAETVATGDAVGS